MRYLHRISKRERERKGPGLAPHIPMPPAATGTAAELQPGLSDSDRAVLELAAAKAPILGPAARARGASLAWAIRRCHPGLSDRELLIAQMPVACWAIWAQDEGVFPAGSWGVVVNAVLAACHELHTGGSDE